MVDGSCNYLRMTAIGIFSGPVVAETNPLVRGSHLLLRGSTVVAVSERLGRHGVWHGISSEKNELLTLPQVISHCGRDVTLILLYI